MKKQLTYIFIITLLTFTACSGDPDEERPETPDDVDIRPEVVFAVADDNPLHIYIESQGVVEAGEEMVIRPRISGFVTESMLDDGYRVEEGEILLAFDDNEWQYQLQQAENELESARIAYEIERNQRRLRDGATDDDRMVRISTGLAEAELALERAKLDVSYATIRAPFSGELSVPERVMVGAYLSSGTELGRLISDRVVRVRFDILESEMNRIERGMSVQITSPSGDRMEGNIRAISPIVDTDSKTGQVVVDVENADRLLRPGMTVEGRIRIESHEGIARIPRSAILERDGGRTLLFKLNNGAVEWVYVEPEYATSEWAIINHEEISPEDTIAVDRHFSLSHLQNVRPRMAGEIVQEVLVE